VALIEHTFNLSGNVRHQGLTMAQVQVLLYDLYPTNGQGLLEPIESVKTGVKGEFSFSVKSGVYRLEIVPDGKTRFLSQTISEVKVVTNTNLNVALTTGCIVEGRVAAGSAFAGSTAQLGELFASCEVVALGIEPTSYRASSSVDSDGQFNLIIPRGKYYFAVRSERFIAGECQIVVVNADSDFTLGLPSFLQFAGSVVDGAGQVVPGASVIVRLAEANQTVALAELDIQAKVITDEAGKFVFDLQEGLYDIDIEPAPGSPYFAYHENALDVTGSPGSHFAKKFVLQEGSALKGKVYFDDRPLSQALVRVQPKVNLNKTEYHALTDADGAFLLSVPEGEYRVTASAHPKDAPAKTIDGHQYSSVAPWSRLVATDEAEPLKIVLTEGTALLGRICDDAQLARPGVNVQIYADAPVESKDEPCPPDKNSPMLASGITDGEGRYGIFLSPGNYWLVVHKDFGNAKFVQIENEPIALDIVWHGWSQLTFHVVGEKGNAVPRCQVFYHPYGQEMDDRPPKASSAMPLPHGYVLTTEAGLCRLTLPAGIYTFKFVPPEAGSFLGKTIRQLSIAGDMARKVTLETRESRAIKDQKDQKDQKSD
jgi:hypothetical protein